MHIEQLRHGRSQMAPDNLRRTLPLIGRQVELVKNATDDLRK
jgi:cysteinyl-tRNA synthetase